MRRCITLVLLLFSLYAVAQNKDKYERITDSLTRSGQTEQLINYFKKELKSNPRSDNILRRLGYLYIKDNQPDLGKKYYEDALALDPKCVRCITNIGLVYELKNDYKKAIEYLNKAIAIDPENPMSYANRARLDEKIGDKSAALYDYDKAVALDFNNAGYYVQRGNYHFKNGSISLAVADMNSAVELAPDSYIPYYQRALIYYSNQKQKEAMTDVNKAIQLDSSQYVLYAFRGAAYAAAEDHTHAIADYTKAIQLNPNDYLSYYKRSLERHVTKDMDGECSDMQRCYALLPEKDSLKNVLRSAIGEYCDATKPGYFYQRGITFYNLQQYQRAVEVYTAGVRKFPGNGMLLSSRGDAQMALKQYSAALEDYKAAKSVVAAARAKFALGQYEEALTVISQVTPDASKEAYYNTRGNILLALGKYQQALADFSKCDSSSSAYIGRAVARINLSNKAKIAVGALSNAGFGVNWVLPLKTTLKIGDDDLFAALGDCSKGIDMDPDAGYGYYLRARIKRLLNSGGQCFDLLKAKELGYAVEPELLSGCRQ